MGGWGRGQHGLATLIFAPRREQQISVVSAYNISDVRAHSEINRKRVRSFTQPQKRRRGECRAILCFSLWPRVGGRGFQGVETNNFGSQRQIA